MSKHRDWERELIELIDQAAQEKSDLAYYQKVEEIINSVEDLIHEAYLKGKLNVRR